MQHMLPEQTDVHVAQPIPWETENLHSPVHNDSSWLISFIDILTILLTVFVLLLVYEQHEPVSISEVEMPPAPVAVSESVTGELNHMIESLQTALNDTLIIDITAEQIRLDVPDHVMFKPASAELTDAGRDALARIAQDIHSMPYLISVEGHTDNTPINTAQFPSNWELSAARATVVTRTLINHGIAANQLRAIGYGDTQPQVNNETAENRARNRRVSFVLELPSN